MLFITSSPVPPPFAPPYHGSEFAREVVPPSSWNALLVLNIMSTVDHSSLSRTVCWSPPSLLRHGLSSEIDQPLAIRMFTNPSQRLHSPDSIFAGLDGALFVEEARTAPALDTHMKMS